MAPSVQCRYTSDCSKGQYCNDLQLCRDVAEGTPCDAQNSCSPSRSAWSTSLTCCSSTGRCASTYSCRYARPFYCSASSPCHEDDYCDTEKQYCVTRIGPGGSCTSSDQVKHGCRCLDGKVVNPCKTDNDCAQDEECSVSYPYSNYYCIKKPSDPEPSVADTSPSSDTNLSSDPNPSSDSNQDVSSNISSNAPSNNSPAVAAEEIQPDAPKNSPSYSDVYTPSYSYSYTAASSYNDISSSDYSYTKSYSYNSSPSYNYSSNYSSSYSSDYYSSRSSSLNWVLPVSISLGLLLIFILGLVARRRRQLRKAALMGKLPNPKVVQVPPPTLDIESSPYSAMAFHPYHPHQSYQAQLSPFPGYVSSVDPYAMPPQQQQQQEEGESHELPPYQPS